MKPELLNGLLRRALDEEMGIVVETNNPNYLYQQLTNLRTKLKLPLIIVRPQGDRVMILKPTVELDP